MEENNEEPQESSGINDFQFYLKLIKPLVITLPKTKDRILAAAWLKKLNDESLAPEPIRQKYLQVLFFCIERQKLCGIFKDNPVLYDTLIDFSEEFNVQEYAKCTVEKCIKQRAEEVRKNIEGKDEEPCPFSTDCSADLLEYVAAQDIPKFGVHVYYAFSKDPIIFWNQSEKGVYSKITKSIPSKSSLLNALKPCICSSSEDEIEEVEAEEGEEETVKTKAQNVCRKSRGYVEASKPKHINKLGIHPPVKPLGVTSIPFSQRAKPMWGSNLLEVKEQPKKITCRKLNVPK